MGDYERKGGNALDTDGRLCLCNGLAGTIGLGQLRHGESEAPIFTTGEDLLTIKQWLSPEKPEYSAGEVIDYLLA
mgnify:CR=1 FL=1